jgi:hypothetical protein
MIYRTKMNSKERYGMQRAVLRPLIFLLEVADKSRYELYYKGMSDNVDK